MRIEEKASQQIAEYQKIADQETGVDLAALAMNALAQGQQDELEEKKKRKAYLVSFALPPFGLIYAVIYAFGGKNGGKRVAVICTILTVVSLSLSWLVLKLFADSIGPSVNTQLQGVKPADIQSLLQQ